jgi:hypothetical protein
MGQFIVTFIIAVLAGFAIFLLLYPIHLIISS